MRILIVTTQVPFVKGGAEILSQELLKALREAKHTAELVAIPFKWYPSERVTEHMLSCQLLDLTESCGMSVDLMICLKFPSYLIPHPNKVLWLLHQHRSAYELWDHPQGDLIYQPNGVATRDTIIKADKKFIPEHKRVFTISRNVGKRLKNFCNIDSQHLYHPPSQSELFYCDEMQDYFFFPSRISSIKRQILVIQALVYANKNIRIKFAGFPESMQYVEELKKMAQELGVEAQIEWLDEIDEQTKLELYANSAGILYPPYDEDYGYVTLEAMLASKPIITCTDSGGTLEFVQHRKTGLIAEPTPQAFAEAMNELWRDREQAQQWGRQGRIEYENQEISWNKVLTSLLA